MGVEGFDTFRSNLQNKIAPRMFVSPALFEAMASLEAEAAALRAWRRR